ncbi:hypothetical protein [Novosphingobium olei]|uniref:DUF7940 domain-containing protein n=1 Tax=Novosphingobium olei TaxID=2728851 RepID=UPI00308882AC|nr:hypothetical protein NSDW_32840 [Novosphingobium olei]
MKLIDECRQAWRFASVRLAIVAGVVAGWAASDPQGFAQLVELLPPWARPLVGIAVSAAAIGTRMAKQTRIGGDA